MYAHHMQYSATDCGIASLKTILKQLKIKLEDENELYQNYNIKKTQGLSIEEMKNILKDYGVTSKAYGVTDFQELKKIEKFPIVMVVENDGLAHYVVLHEIIDDKTFVVSDPAEANLLYYSEADLQSIFLGYALCISDSNKQLIPAEKKKKKDINLGKRLYKESIKALSLSVKVKTVCFILLKFTLPIIITFLIQNSMGLNWAENQTGIIVTVAFVMALMIGYYFINISEGKQKVKLENAMQETILMNYYTKKVSGFDICQNNENVTGYFWNLFSSVSGLLEKFYLNLNVVYVALMAVIVLRVSLPLFAALILWSVMFILYLVMQTEKIRSNQRNIINKSSAFSTSVENNIRSSLDINLFSKNKSAEVFVKSKIQEYFKSKNDMTITDLKMSSSFQVVSSLIMLSAAVIFWVSYWINNSTSILLNSSNGILMISIILSSVAPILQCWIAYQKSTVAIDYIQSGEDYSKRQVKTTEERLPVDYVESIEIDDLNFSYKNDKVIFNQAAMRFESGNIYALTGDNGCGKSTLLKLLSGVLEPDSGTININDDIERTSLKNTDIREHISIYSPEFRLYDSSVGRNIRYKVFNESLTLDEKQNYNDLLGLELSNNYVIEQDGSNLSQGQKQKILLMRALQQDRSIYIFDEPTSNLDQESKEKFIEQIRVLAEEKNKIVLMVSHELDIQKYAHHIIDVKYINERVMV